MTEFANIELPLIVGSLTNPRKTFNPVKLTELANSIKASGVHQPILVRPLPGSRVEETSWNSEHGKQLTRRAVRPTYEIVAGERRYRASQEAGATTIPAMIRELTDDQVLEIQIVENLQRDDLTELEEAEGYEALMAHSKISADDVGVKIGKSRSYVFGRLKLLDLSQESKQALREGQIDASRALLIARIPDSKLQAKALIEATRKDGWGDTPSVRSFQSWLVQNVMLRLDSAPFKITDARLVKAAGSCKDCPKRTGANPDLFADVTSADICTDPACYGQKATAHRASVAAQAESKGLALIEGKEAKRVVDYSGKLKGYLPLNQVREDAGTAVGSMATGMRSPTLRELLGKDGVAEVKPVLIEHPTTRELIEAVPTEEAEALLVVRGLIKATKSQITKQEELSSEIEYLQGQVKRKSAIAERAAAFKFITDAVRATPDKEVHRLLTGDLLREWFISRLGCDIDEDDMANMLGYTFEDGVDEIDALSMHLRACSSATLIRALVIWMAKDDESLPYHFNDKAEDPPMLKALERTMQISYEDAVKEARAEVKADVVAQIKGMKTQLKAIASPAAPAPASETSSRGEGGEKAKPGKTAAARKPKLNASEAMSGIAAAMQSADASTSAPDGAVASTSSSTTEAAVDPLLASAKALVVRQQKASVRLLKSELSVGTTKALALMDQLEQAAVVSAVDQRGAREVLVAA